MVSVGLSSEWTKECLSTQHTFYDFISEAAPAKALCTDGHLTFSPNEKCATKSLLPLDHNANICLSPDEPHNGPLESADSQPCSSLEQPPNNPVTTALTWEDSSEEIPTPHPVERRDQNSEPTSAEDKSALCAERWRSKRRKQSRPSRSVSAQDPDFQGVTFRMDTELDETKEQCRLLITSKYSTDLPKSLKRTRLRTRMSQKSLKTSSDEDSDSATSEAKDKVCASCCTKKTPMWRDAEDGTPLCNACGIRYKKYRVRCINCWNIPKKDGNSVSCCSKCGHFVRLTSAQRRPTV
ncbi:GATA-type zinc finger protein 1 [Eucyclogobius newberryi]|uniref:GATA-type zinc finger protein 1 n=1 Tax=Eucyclogobius newberryi TaxID=166745 RepID=UPI003B5CF977